MQEKLYTYFGKFSESHNFHWTQFWNTYDTKFSLIIRVNCVAIDLKLVWHLSLIFGKWQLSQLKAVADKCNLSYFATPNLNQRKLL